MSTLSRRRIIQAMTAALGMSAFNLSWAQGAKDNKFVFIILRGAMDGLTAVPPLGDPHYARLRGDLAVSRAGTRRLDADFALHNNLATLHSLYTQKQAVVFHAIASPFKTRSHFEGQDVLETGGTRLYQQRNGWLGRALSTMPSRTGLSVGQSVPLVLQGGSNIMSWSPSRAASPEEDTIERLLSIYEQDAELGALLERAIETEMKVGMAVKGNANNPRVVARAIAALMTSDGGPNIAVIDINGWDTHRRQGVDRGLLPNKFKELDQTVAALKSGMGASDWDTTAVLVATEFGRTARPNGTLGTDHGTGGAGFLLGGAVNGGRVIADWPGLRDNQLLQNRDLKPTLDWHSVFKSVLSDHMRVGTKALDGTVFPDSKSTAMMRGLFR